MLGPDGGNNDEADDNGRCGVINVDRPAFVDSECPGKEGVGDDDDDDDDKADNVVDCLSLRGDTECLLRGGIITLPPPPLAPPVVVEKMIGCVVVAKVADALSWSTLLLLLVLLMKVSVVVVLVEVAVAAMAACSEADSASRLRDMVIGRGVLAER